MDEKILILWFVNDAGINKLFLAYVIISNIEH